MAKKITTKEDIVNPNSICIFTDCSFSKYDKYIVLPDGSTKLIGVTAPAYCIYVGDHMVEQWYNIVPGLSSQEGEHYAIMLAIQAVYRYSHFPKINIFSDSLTTVCAIRERNIRYMYDDPNRLAKMDQKYLIEPIYDLMNNGIPIDFYYVPGHVKMRSDDSIQSAKVSFENNNPWVGKVDLPLVRYIAMGNNAVDEYSTTMLRSYCDSTRPSMYNQYISPIQYFYRPFTPEQIAEYKKLVLYSKERLVDGYFYE